MLSPDRFRKHLKFEIDASWVSCLLAVMHRSRLPQSLTIVLPSISSAIGAAGSRRSREQVLLSSRSSTLDSTRSSLFHSTPSPSTATKASTCASREEESSTFDQEETWAEEGMENGETARRIWRVSCDDIRCSRFNFLPVFAQKGPRTAKGSQSAFVQQKATSLTRRR